MQILVKNVHVRFEDEILFPGHSFGLIWESLVIKPSDHFWEFHWPGDANPTELSLGPSKTQCRSNNRFSDNSTVLAPSSVDIDVSSLSEDDLRSSSAAGTTGAVEHDVNKTEYVPY